MPTHSISPGTPRPPGWGWRPPWTNLLIPPSCISYSQQLFVAPLWYFRGAPLYIWQLRQPQMNPFLHLYFQMKYKWNILFALVLRAWWIEGVTGRLLIDMFGIIPDSHTPQRYHHQANQCCYHHTKISCCLAFAGGGSQQCCERNFCTMQSSQAILWLVAGL